MSNPVANHRTPRLTFAEAQRRVRGELLLDLRSVRDRLQELLAGVPRFTYDAPAEGDTFGPHPPEHEFLFVLEEAVGLLEGGASFMPEGGAIGDLETAGEQPLGAAEADPMADTQALCRSLAQTIRNRGRELEILLPVLEAMQPPEAEASERWERDEPTLAMAVLGHAKHLLGLEYGCEGLLPEALDHLDEIAEPEAEGAAPST